MANRSRRIALVGVVALAVLLLAVSLLATRHDGGASSASFQAGPLAVGTALTQLRPTPKLSLIDERGKSLRLSAFAGKWVVFAPAMTLCHEVCPMTTGTFMQLTARLHQAGLADRAVVAEVTVDPWRDTPARLRAYRRLVGVNFTLLTGTPAEIRRFWKFFGVYYQRVPQGNPPDIDWLTHKRETYDIQHTDGLFILDPTGRERMADEGMPDVDGQLSPALRRLLDEEGRQNLAHPQSPWTAAQVLDDLHQLMRTATSANMHIESGH